jgi:pilus assembly protein CpaF
MKLTDRLQRRSPGREESRSGGRSRRSAVLSDEVVRVLYAEVIDRLDTQGATRLDPAELSATLAELVGQSMEARGLALSDRQREALIRTISDEILGLGPLEPLLADPGVTDILVNGAASIYVERNGVLEETGVRFRDDEHLLNTINRMVSQVGRRIDEASPMVDARLADGSRVNAIIAPLALDGPLLSIRRFAREVLGPEELVRRGALSHEMALYLRSAVRARCNILVCGGTGAGKTTFLNALSRFISRRERIVTIEDSAELQLQQKHVARLETRPPNLEGKGEVTVRDLVRNALRMRPDRIIVGEVRSDEVLDMIQAMNTGHEGSMTTIHANSVQDAFTRLMSMLGMAGTKLSEPMMLQMISRAMDVVIHLVRDRDGQRRVSAVAEIAGLQGAEVQLNHVYTWERARGGGRWRCSGTSLLLERFAEANVPLDRRCLAPTTPGT